MNTTTLPSTGFRTQVLIWVGTALGIVVLSASLVWFVAPALSPYSENPNPAPIHHLFHDAAVGRTAAAALQACVGTAASTVGLAALFGRRGLTPLLSGLAIATGAVCAIGLTGLRGVVAAGYTLAHGLPLIILVLLVFAMRTTAARVLVAILGLALTGFLVLGPTPLQPWYREFAAYVVANPTGYLTPLVLVLFAGAWLLVGAVHLTRAPGTVGRLVFRHRVAITVAAACCSLPYVFARLSWLTPWPLFGDPRDYEDATLALVNGLFLGAAMLVGGVLTLGLILPWGTRIPRWFGRAGGKPVPVALAVVPALTVAILFIAAGLDSLLLAGEPGTALAAPVLTTAIIFPFWLWGPLLALATWGYVLHRRVDTDDHTVDIDETKPTERIT